MNAQIKELAEQLPISLDVQKSIVNRLESALTKTGSAQSRLRMASQSMNALANKYEADSDESGYADLFARIFAISAEIAIDNKKPATEKTKRENWHDADSKEVSGLLTPPLNCADCTKTTKRKAKLFRDCGKKEMSCVIAMKPKPTA